MTGRARVSRVVRLQIPVADVARVHAVAAVARGERRDARAVVVRAEGARQRRERPLRDAAAADEPAIGARHDDGEVGFPAAERAVARGSMPTGRRAVQSTSVAAREERPQREQQHLIEAGRRDRRAGAACGVPRCRRRPTWRCTSAATSGSSDVAVAAERHDRARGRRARARRSAAGCRRSAGTSGGSRSSRAECRRSARAGARRPAAPPAMPGPAESTAAARAPARDAASRPARSACRPPPPARAGSVLSCLQFDDLARFGAGRAGGTVGHGGNCTRG